MSYVVVAVPPYGWTVVREPTTLELVTDSRDEAMDVAERLARSACDYAVVADDEATRALARHLVEAACHAPLVGSQREPSESATASDA